MLARQLAMNPETWRALREHGVTEQTELRLDFFYRAPHPESAETLASFLRDQTDYDVEVRADGVAGSTQTTTVSAEVLDNWATWMVLAGHENGRCEFDEWGAEVP